MEVANLVLEYLKVLAVPGTVIAIAILFRAELKGWMTRTKLPVTGSADIPGIGRYSWGATADRLGEDATEALESMGDEAAERLPLDQTSRADVSPRSESRELAPPSTGRDPNLLNLKTAVGYRDWTQLRALAVENPVAAVLDTWRTVAYKFYEVAYSEKAVGFEEDWKADVALAARRLGASQRMSAILADLRDLKDRAESGEAITRSDALEYIEAALTISPPWKSHNSV